MRLHLASLPHQLLYSVSIPFTPTDILHQGAQHPVQNAFDNIKVIVEHLEKTKQIQESRERWILVEQLRLIVWNLVRSLPSPPLCDYF